MDIKVNKQTVLCFDLDDTLYNEIEYLKSAYKEISKHLSNDNWVLLYAKIFSLYRKKENVFQYLIDNFSISKEELLIMYRNHIPEIKPFNGVISLLEEIKAAHGILCVITDGRSVTQRNKLKALGILDFFDEIIISEEIGSEKPSEANYLRIEKKFPNCSYTYIADNFKKDFIVPNQRGWNSIGLVDNGLNIHNNTFDYQRVEHEPKHVITHIGELGTIETKI